MFVLFNLLLAAGTRSLLEQLLTHKRLREITMLLVVLGASVPQVLISTASTPGPLKQWASGAPWRFWPWSAVATSALGGDFVMPLVILAIWTGAAWRFGRWQFERGLNFDAQASGVTSANRPERSHSWLEGFYRSPSLLPDPLAVIVEKSLHPQPHRALPHSLHHEFTSTAGLAAAGGTEKSATWSEHYLR